MEEKTWLHTGVIIRMLDYFTTSADKHFCNCLAVPLRQGKPPFLTDMGAIPGQPICNLYYTGGAIFRPYLALKTAAIIRSTNIISANIKKQNTEQ
jgi:hypothetical protein